jgi:hypothetical protein
MCKLNAGDASNTGNKSGDPLKGVRLIIAPEAEVAGGYPPFGGDSGRLNNDQRCASYCPAAKMDQMPVVGHPIDGRILAHGRDGDAVLQRDAAKGEGTEKMKRRGVSFRGIVHRFCFRCCQEKNAAERLSALHRRHKARRE